MEQQRQKILIWIDDIELSQELYEKLEEKYLVLALVAPISKFYQFVNVIEMDKINLAIVDNEFKAAMLLFVGIKKVIILRYKDPLRIAREMNTTNKKELYETNTIEKLMELLEESATAKP
jgi:hypothetical protein